MKSIPKIRRISRLPKSEPIIVRRTDADITRDRQRNPIEIGEDPLEQRAIPRDWFAGATLPERIVYKKLMEMVGEDRIIFQRSEQGGRAIIGGFVIDFLVYVTNPPILIEVQGMHWHQPKDAFRDIERALVMTSLGYEYNEIWEDDIYQSDERLEDILGNILNRWIVRGPNERA